MRRDVMKILNFGSANLDYVYSLDHIVGEGETERSEAMNIFAGGKGLNQSVAAARAGASFVSPFIGRLDDIASDGTKLIKTIAGIFREHKIGTEIIAASIRDPEDVIESAVAGADIATVPYGVINRMICHPLTDAGIARFLKDWESVK